MSSHLTEQVFNLATLKEMGNSPKAQPLLPSRFQPILGTLIYIWNRLDDTVLLVHRVARTADEQFGKWNGLGGKVEPDEDIISSARRELVEEACLEPQDLTLRGTISWPGFGPQGEDWFGFVFIATQWVGEVPTHNEEGPLEWVSKQRVLEACDPSETIRTQSRLTFWEGDRHFLPLIFDDDPRAFHAVMPYANGKPTSWSYVR
jgi:8-oxo-dGTP diphosphatase